MISPPIPQLTPTSRIGPAALSSVAAVPEGGTMPAPAADLEPLSQVFNAPPSEQQARLLAALSDQSAGPASVAKAVPWGELADGADVDAALGLRARHLDAGIALADELIAQLSLALQTAPDAATRNRLQAAIGGLQQFKEDLRTHRRQDEERSQRLRDDERQATKVSERKRLAREALEARAAIRFDTGQSSGLQLGDRLHAQMQRALIAQTVASGERFAPPGGPLDLGVAMATHLDGLLRPARFVDTSAAELLARLRGRLAATD